MGEQPFRTESSDHTSVSIDGGIVLNQDYFSGHAVSWSAVQNSDVKIPTAKAAQDRVDTISAASGFEQKHWGTVLTESGINYIPISPVSNQAEGRNEHRSTISGNDAHYNNPRFYPFTLNKELSLKGVTFKTQTSDTGPLWICIWKNTHTLTNISNGPGDLFAYIKCTWSGSSGSNSVQLFIDRGTDGIVYNSSHSNGHVTIPAGLYWYSIHAQNNDAGNNSYSMFWVSQNNKQKLFYTGGAPGTTIGFRGTSFGVNYYGLKYTNNNLSPTSDSWTPPSSFSTASEFEEETSKGPYVLGFCML